MPRSHRPGEAPRLLIEGIGGVGGVLAAAALDAGFEPVLVTGNPEITRALRERGLERLGPSSGTRPVAEVVTELAELPADRRFEVAWMVMKANRVVAAAAETVGHLSADGCLVTFQNGVVEEAVSAVTGAGRVVAGIIGWGGTMHGPGRYERTSPGKTFIGELDGRRSARVERLSCLLAPAGPVEISENIRGALWAKLAINCTVTTLGAVTGETLGEMLADRRVRRLFLRAYSEVVETAEAAGVVLEPIAVHPRLLYLPANAGRLRAAVEDLLVRVVARRYGRVRSSMLQSLERGRPTEIDFLNGYVVRRAAGLGVAVPINAALVRQIREIEAGTRPMARANVEELLLSAR